MEGKVIKMRELTRDYIDRKRNCMLGVITMLFIGEFINEDIMEVGDEAHEKFRREITNTLDDVIETIEAEGPPDILDMDEDMEEDMDRFRDALKEFIHHEMEEE